MIVSRKRWRFFFFFVCVWLCDWTVVASILKSDGSLINSRIFFFFGPRWFSFGVVSYFRAFSEAALEVSEKEERKKKKIGATIGAWKKMLHISSKSRYFFCFYFKVRMACRQIVFSSAFGRQQCSVLFFFFYIHATVSAMNRRRYCFFFFSSRVCPVDGFLATCIGHQKGEKKKTRQKNCASCQ